VDTAAAKALVELANQKNGTLTEDSRHLMRSSIQSSPPKENAQTKDDDSPSINRGITPVLVQLYSNELHPDVRECFEISGRSSSAHAVGMNVGASDRQDKSEAATYTGVANQVVTLQGTHVEIKNLLREREAALRAAETTIASMRLKASTAISNRQQLVDAVFRLANAVNGSVENNEMSNREIETLLSTFSAERDQLAKVVEVKTAELSAMRQELSYSLSRLVELQSEFEKQSVLNNDAEKRVNELLSENNRANENMVAMQAKNDDVIMKLDSVEAQLETLVLEQQALLRRSMTISTEKQNEIEYLKRQAAKRMSQVYELTDLLTKALTEKSELDSKLQSATADQTQMRDTISSQTSKISQLESSNSPLLTNGNVNSQAIGTSCVKVNGTKMFLETEAVANSKKLGTTFDELQAQIKCLSTGLLAAKDVNIKLTCQIGATNSRYNTLAMKHKECLNELEKVSNEKANAEATYKNRIHELEESINEQNEEMKALHVAVATSQAQTVDLTAQVTTLTSEREECNAKLEEAAKEMSQLQSTIVILNTQGYTTEALFQDLRLDLKADVSKTRTPEKSLHGNSTALLANEMGELGDEAHHHNERSVSVASDSLDDEDEPTNVQLFAFDATLEGNNWGRPKRKLKSIARFESMTFDPKKAAQCKIGEGFSFPRCSAVCSYDAKECEDCQLACYYEAGIGVVVLKERKVTSGLNSNHQRRLEVK
jgi:chromosome segregation ATPase